MIIQRLEIKRPVVTRLVDDVDQLVRDTFFQRVTPTNGRAGRTIIVVAFQHSDRWSFFLPCEKRGTYTTCSFYGDDDEGAEFLFKFRSRQREQLLPDAWFFRFSGKALIEQYLMGRLVWLKMVQHGDLRAFKLLLIFIVLALCSDKFLLQRVTCLGQIAFFILRIFYDG